MTVDELIARCDNLSANGDCTIILCKQESNNVMKQEFKRFNAFAISAIEGDLIGHNVRTFKCLPNYVYIDVY